MVTGRPRPENVCACAWPVIKWYQLLGTTALFGRPFKLAAFRLRRLFVDKVGDILKCGPASRDVGTKLLARGGGYLTNLLSVSVQMHCALPDAAYWSSLDLLFWVGRRVPGPVFTLQQAQDNIQAPGIGGTKELSRTIYSVTLTSHTLLALPEYR